MNFNNFFNKYRKLFKNKSFILYGNRDFTKIILALYLYKKINQYKKLKILVTKKNYLFSKKFLNIYNKYIKIYKNKIQINKTIIKKNYFYIIYCLEDCNNKSIVYLKTVLQKHNCFFLIITFNINKYKKIQSLTFVIKYNDNHILQNFYYKKYLNIARYITNKKIKKKKRIELIIKNKRFLEIIYINICIILKAKNFFLFFKKLCYFLKNKKKFLAFLTVLIVKFI
ncbi:hypothetical protein [Candidatus Vidania fulgoroideorum]